MSRVHIALFTPGYPYVDAALRAAQHRAADYLLMIDDDIVAPADAAERLLALEAAVATAPSPIALHRV